jgi:uncharacterized phiE125 gp8 family phage protein
MSASAPLCNLADVKLYLDITTDDHDDLLTSLISAASEAIENFCRRRFARAEYTEYHNGRGSPVLLLDHCPVQSVAEIRDDLDRDFDSAAPLDPGSYAVYPEEGLVVLTADNFREGARNVRVIYSAGYSQIPLDVARACIVLVAAWFARGRQGGDGVEREQLGPYSVKYAGRSLPRDVTDLLLPYLEISV